MPSVVIREDVHIKIKERQIAFARDGKYMRVADIVNKSILAGIDNIDEKMNE